MEQLRNLGQQLVSSLQEAAQNLLAYLPVVLLAIVLLVAGWLVARLLRKITLKSIERLDWLFSQATARSAEDAETVRQGVGRAVSAIVFWTVLLSFAAAALAGLGSPVVESWTQDLLAYMPVLLGGVAIILLGIIGGTLARHVVEPAAASVGVAHSAVFGRLTQAVIIVTSIVIGTAQLGIDVSFVTQLTTVMVAAVLAGLALALALGVREHLSNLIGIRYARKHYRIGERLRIGDFDGRIIEITDGFLFLETEDGDVSIPGSHFSRSPFVKMTGETQNV